MKVRVSMHNGRTGSARHNDRSFLNGKTDLQRATIAPHIKSNGNENVFWCYQPEVEFSEAELNFYKTNYLDSLNATNKRYKDQYHPERCKTISDIYNSPKTRPEETILQIGDRYADISKELFVSCVNDYLTWINNWNMEHGDHMHILNVAIHFDEESPHAHIRRVWDYVDKDGFKRLGQNKALEAAGVMFPFPNKEEGRYNNRKISFDQMARETWQKICSDHNIEIEIEPRPTLKHKEKNEYISAKLEEEIQQKEEKISELEYKIDELERKASVLTATQIDELVQNDVVENDNKVYLSKDVYLQLINNARKADVITKQANKLINDYNSRSSKLYAEINQYRKMEKMYPDKFRKMRRSLRIKNQDRDR